MGDVKDEVVFAALGALRFECAKQLGILDPKDFKFLWVTEFPMFEWSEEEGRYQAMHHPFTAPMVEDEDKMLTDKANCRARAYDIVLNGTELGGGSIRINTPEMQTKAFEALGISNEDIQERFGHLVGAFQYGAPPHGGLAYGLDRLVMLMTGASSIRDVIAFPKVQNASDLMMNCPDVVDQKQLDDLAIAVTRMEEEAAEEEKPFPGLNPPPKRFAPGKTLPQAEFISAEEVKSATGVPARLTGRGRSEAAGRFGDCCDENGRRSCRRGITFPGF